MKNFLLLLLTFILGAPMLSATNADESQEIKYTDFIPRFTQINPQFTLTKVEYSEREVVLFFRMVAASDKESVQFFGSEHPKALKINTSQRPPNPSEVLVRTVMITNIRINDKKQDATLAATAEKEYKLQKGDILSCEMQFLPMPNYVRTINLLGGEVDAKGNPRFMCSNLQVKTQASGLLGDKAQMRASIEKFYNAQKTVKNPSILEITTLVQDSIFALREKEHVKQSVSIDARPVEYMPRSLNTIADFACNERLILPNVYFEDSKDEFTRRVPAMKTISLIAEYMVRIPTSKITLHGHTDVQGDMYKNLELSEKRVMVVKRELVSKGIDPKRIITHYYGGQYPLPLYKDGGAMNRRVEVEVICKDANTNAQK
jgi:outer membrane protein OmpA-like peptidoglycan-associated protein